MRYKNFLLPLFFFLIIFAGCSIKDTVKSKGEDDILRERVMTYCNHRINSEFEKSYQYEDTLYRKKVSLGMYTRRMSGGLEEWKTAEIKDLKIVDEDADVNLKLRVKVRLSMAGAKAAVRMKDVERDTEITQKWKKIDGVWQHIFGSKESLAD
jgi:hypothetical protein